MMKKRWKKYELSEITSMPTQNEIGSWFSIVPYLVSSDWKYRIPQTTYTTTAITMMMVNHAAYGLYKGDFKDKKITLFTYILKNITDLLLKYGKVKPDPQLLSMSIVASPVVVEGDCNMTVQDIANSIT